MHLFMTVTFLFKIFIYYIRQITNFMVANITVCVDATRMYTFKNVNLKRIFIVFDNFVLVNSTNIVKQILQILNLLQIIAIRMFLGCP